MSLMTMRADDIELTRVELREVGVHSVQNGSENYLKAFPNGASGFEILLRGGWPLGQLQSKGIKIGNDRDTFLGRVVAMVRQKPDVAMTMLPPHFADADLPTALLDAAMTQFIHYPNSFKRVIPYLLASLVYHKNWLQRNLPSSHPLFRENIWHIICGGEIKVYTGYNSNKITGMVASGVPLLLQVSSNPENISSGIPLDRPKPQKRVNSKKVEINQEPVPLPAERDNQILVTNGIFPGPSVDFDTAKQITMLRIDFIEAALKRGDAIIKAEGEENRKRKISAIL